MMRHLILIAALAALPGAGLAQNWTVGPKPLLPSPQTSLLPDMTIPRPVDAGSRLPQVPQGWRISAIASGLKIPRRILVLPNGDLLIAEGKGQSAPVLRPKDLIAGFIKGLGKSPEPGGNRLTLLRDADGDGTYELNTVFAANLNSPYGLAYTEGVIWVATQDAVLRFDWVPGQTSASAAPKVLAALPAAINHHWTKAMTASADGQFLYVGIGSNSNITERGIAAEEDRAMIWQISTRTGAHRPYATGLRNPTALAVQPGSGQLWTVVNERDELGPDLVPDYLTSVQEGGFYGWPWSWWGQNPDRRAQPPNPGKIAGALVPDYALGAHVAALGLAFSDASMGAGFAEGVFVGQHGSWNRTPPSGYKVVFVPFAGGKPAGSPQDVVTGFLTSQGDILGRPVGVAVDPRGALLVADDVANTIWRVTPGG